MNERDFLRQLEQAPELPGDLYDSIQSKLNAKRTLSRTLWSVAALLILTLASLTAIHFIQYTEQPALSANEKMVVEELQIVRSFLFGESIEEEFESYALVNFEDLAVTTTNKE